MHNNSSRLNLGILATGSKIWLGGVSYTELLIKSLRSLPAAEQPKITLVLPETLITDPESTNLFAAMMEWVDELAIIYPAELILEGQQSKPTKIYKSYAELSADVDFLYPAQARVISGIPNASWWPDFQHKHLPHFFKAHDIQERDHALNNIYANAKCVVFSSKDAQNDFSKFYPGYAGQTAVLPFFASASNTHLDPFEVAKKYNLKPGFFLCCNQFWIHKNHTLIFKALAELKAQSITPQVAFTGQTLDDRHPEYFKELMQLRTELGLDDNTQILGVIPREDQQQLIRASAAMIQPSLFEGWSTVIEDARAYGKPIFLSDLAVHFEQAPRYGVYFSRHDHQALARLIASFDCDFAGSQRLARETLAQKESVILAQNLGKSLMQLALHFQQPRTVAQTQPQFSYPNLSL